MHLLRPFLCSTSGDYPQQQKQLSQMTSAQSRSPCHICLLTPLNLTCACTHAPKPLLTSEAPPGQPHLSIAGAAAVEPSAPPGSSNAHRRLLKSIRDGAQSLGGVLMGRPAAPFTIRALQISSPVSADNYGSVGLLHTLGSCQKHLVHNLFLDDPPRLAHATFAGATQELEARVGDLREIFWGGCPTGNKYVSNRRWGGNK